MLGMKDEIKFNAKLKKDYKKQKLNGILRLLR